MGGRGRRLPAAAGTLRGEVRGVPPVVLPIKSISWERECWIHMGRLRVIGLCLVAVFAISAVMAGSASAAGPSFGRCLKQTGGKYENSGCTKEAKEVAKQKFEWTNTLVKNKFSAKQKEATLATLETVGGTKITCTGESNTGAEYTGLKTVAKIVAFFTGCETSKMPCNSTGKGSGEITNN